MVVSILWAPDVKNWLFVKDPDAGKDWGQEVKWMTEDEIVGWHHWLNGREFEQAQEDSEGQENLACCSPWVPVRHNLATEQQQMCVCQSQSPTLIIPPPCFLTWYHKFVFCGSVDGRKLLGGSTWHEDKDMVPEK